MSESSQRRAILAAARECFARRGVHRTRMEDVAAGAGMTRQNVYRYVSGRDELVELAILERARELAAEVLEDLEPGKGKLRAKFVEAIVGVVMLAREDPEFGYLTEATPRVRLNVLMAGGESPMHENVREFFAPLLDRAREEGALRDDVGEDEIVEWLQGVLTLFPPRTDLEGKALERVIEKFTLPVVLV